MRLVKCIGYIKLCTVYIIINGNIFTIYYLYIKLYYFSNCILKSDIDVNINIFLCINLVKKYLLYALKMSL